MESWRVMADHDDQEDRRATLYRRAIEMIGTDEETSISMLTDLAEEGYPFAAAALGQIYARRGDPAAVRWYVQGAEAGIPEAMHNLAGLLFETDPDEAERWLRRGSEQDHPGCIGALGYQLGIRGHQDEAVKYLEIAAHRLEQNAPYYLGYFLAETAPLDAIRWSEIGVARGDQRCVPQALRLRVKNRVGLREATRLLNQMRSAQFREYLRRHVESRLSEMGYG